MTPPRPRIVLAINTAWNLVNFRAPLIRALQQAGYEVVAVAPPDAYAGQVEALGCRFLPLPMDNRGTHPGRDLALVARFLRLLRRERPQLFLGFTVKPNIYGSLAAQLLGIPVINTITGLGATFIAPSFATRVVRTAYRFLLPRARAVLFQNPDDRALFHDLGLVPPARSRLVAGSGIDLTAFTPTPPPPSDSPFRFLLLGRLLWDKGVGEYVDAARRLRNQGLAVECQLLGFLDVPNPAAISREQVDQWVAEGVVRYLGHTDQVQTAIAQAHCVVLPSYREGTPRTLLEAAAMARPIVATNVPGCREVVDDGVTGFLCPARDAEGLAAAMQAMVALPADARAAMGARGREKMARTFDVQQVLAVYLSEIDHAMASDRPWPTHPVRRETAD